jgi:hypothetical protein
LAVRLARAEAAFVCFSGCNGPYNISVQDCRLDALVDEPHEVHQPQHRHRRVCSYSCAHTVDSKRCSMPRQAAEAPKAPKASDRIESKRTEDSDSAAQREMCGRRYERACVRSNERGRASPSVHALPQGERPHGPSSRPSTITQYNRLPCTRARTEVAHTHACTHTRPTTHTHTHTHTHTQTHKHTQTRAYKCTHTHKRTHMHTHRH